MRNETHSHRAVLSDVQFDISKWKLAALFRSRARTQAVSVHRVINPYHAVSIVPGSPACPAVKRLGPQRFLSAEAPRIPLPECTWATCKCRYRHHDDRRARARRAADQGVPIAAWEGMERRTKRGRRITDN